LADRTVGPPRLGLRRSSIPRKPGDCVEACQPYGRPPTRSPASRGTGERSPCDSSRGGRLADRTGGPPRLGLRRSSIPRRPGDERKKPSRGGTWPPDTAPASSTGPNAVSRSAGDRRAVALRPEPRGHLADRTSAWPTPQTGTAAARGHQSRDTTSYLVRTDQSLKKYREGGHNPQSPRVVDVGSWSSSQSGSSLTRVTSMV